MPHARIFPHPIRQFAAWVIALAAMLLLAAGAQAEPVGGRKAQFGDKNIAVTLHAEGQPAMGKEWLLALRFMPSAPEWHGYWKNPGDAGQGMRLSLNLPPGTAPSPASKRTPPPSPKARMPASASAPMLLRPAP